jgi:hypothetical protein
LNVAVIVCIVVIFFLFLFGLYIRYIDQILVIGVM